MPPNHEYKIDLSPFFLPKETDESVIKKPNWFVKNRMLLRISVFVYFYISYIIWSGIFHGKYMAVHVCSSFSIMSIYGYYHGKHITRLSEKGLLIIKVLGWGMFSITFFFVLIGLISRK